MLDSDFYPPQSLLSYYWQHRRDELVSLAKAHWFLAIFSNFLIYLTYSIVVVELKYQHNLLNTMILENLRNNNTKGSSLTFSAQGGWGKEKKLAAGKNPVRPSKGMAEGGCGGNSAIPLQKIEASPAACSVRSRTQQKSFLFLLEEKIGRAQNQKCRENFFAGWRALASGGGLASLVGFPFVVGSRKVYNYSTKTNFVGIDCSARRVRRAPQGKIRFCFRREIP